MSDPASTRNPKDAQAVVSYLATMSADLAALARQHGLDTLGYLLEMARLEAENNAREREIK